MAIARMRVLYAGRVQGVGFRMTAERLASGSSVVGYVRNLDDGRVELVAEGETAALEAYLERVRFALSTRIHASEMTEIPAGTPAFTDFSIRY